MLVLMYALLGCVQSFSYFGLQSHARVKSAHNRDLINGSLQVLHIHVLLVAAQGAGPVDTVGQRPA